jgi:hypothetical protein
MLTPSEMLLHATVRIESIKQNGDTSCGTGFFFRLFADAESSVPVIVTNKHVIDGETVCRFHVSIAGPDGLPDYSNHICIEVPAPQWLRHPDPDIDLAVLTCGRLFNDLVKRGKAAFWIGLEPNLIWTDEKLRELTPLEHVTIIGYPNGIWDSKHNLPVFRRGITATPVYMDREGRPEFMVDASVFPGSSGSPVFLFDQGIWTDRGGNTILGQTRIALLGVIHSVAQHMATGEIKFEHIPTVSRPFALSGIPNNLGVCVKAHKILDFERVIVAGGGFAPPAIYTMRSTWRPVS